MRTRNFNCVITFGIGCGCIAFASDRSRNSRALNRHSGRSHDPASNQFAGTRTIDVVFELINRVEIIVTVVNGRQVVPCIVHPAPSHVDVIIQSPARISKPVSHHGMSRIGGINDTHDHRIATGQIRLKDEISMSRINGITCINIPRIGIAKSACERRCDATHVSR